MSNGHVVDQALKGTPEHCRGKLVDFLDKSDLLKDGIRKVQNRVSQCFVHGANSCNCIEEGEREIDELFLAFKNRR